MLDEGVVRAMERVRKETGISVSVQIQLALQGNQVGPDCHRSTRRVPKAP